jgi:phage baseplate assembly protein W
MSTGNRAYLGSGWSFPPELDHRGRIRLVHEEEDVRQAIHMILSTHRGERQMRPEFGSDLWRLQFAPCDDSTTALACRVVREALERWEPRVEVITIHCDPRSFNSGALQIDIRYQIRSDHSEHNLVYPFYIIPGGD